MEKPWDLFERTMQFAVAVFNFCRTLARNVEARDAVAQLRRAGAAVGANYRAARRGRSDKDFANKIGVAIEEADEAEFWCEYLARTALTEREAVRELQREASELVAIFTAAQKTAKAKHQNKKKRNGSMKHGTSNS